MKTAVYDKQIKIMGRTLVPDTDRLIRPAAYFLAGLILSQFDAVEGISPFTYSAVAACDEELLFSCFFGCCAGYLIRGGFLQTLIRYITLSAILGIRILVKKKGHGKRERLIACLSAAAVPAVCSAVRLAVTGFGVYPAICAACEAALAAGGCLFFHTFFHVPFIRIGISRLSRRDSAFVYCALFLLVLCASGVKIGQIRPAHILLMFAVLLFSHYKGIPAGCICAVAAGAALCLHEDTRHLLTFFALGGFAAGAFSGLGQVGCSVALCASAGAVALFSGWSKESLITLLEAAGAGIAFAAVPQSLLMKLENYLDESGYMGSFPPNRLNASDIIRASRSVGETAQMIEDVFFGMETVSKTAMNRVYADIQKSVCKDCHRKNTCWSRDFETTCRTVRHIMTGKAPGEIKCEHTDELCAAVARRKKLYNDTLTNETEKKEMRLVALDGFRLCSALLEDAAHKLCGNRIYDFTKSEMISSALAREDIGIQKLLYSTDLDGRSYVELFVNEEAANIKSEKIRSCISRVSLKSFDPPQFTPSDFYTRLDFSQSPSYEVTVGSRRYAASDGCECGDSIECFTDGDENAICVISDGMGTGTRAAIDGTLTSTLIRNLSLAGFGFESILRFVNSALLIKSSDESLATVDILKINTCTGIALLCKAGAAPTFLRSGEEITCVSRPSLPAGILRSIDLTRDERRLESGDIVLMVSDGVIARGDKWLREELSAWSTADMDELAGHIASLARKRSDKAHRDDISVIAVRVVKKKL